jgi:endonuclease YncB( thermonuclease family)
VNIWRTSTLASIVVALSLLGTPVASSAQSIMGVASVIDGDTIEIHGTRIRPMHQQRLHK